MDSFTFAHLSEWVSNHIDSELQLKTFTEIYTFVSEHPVVLERGDSWPEILRLIERNTKQGIGK